ncbi:hypothetical protein PV326_002737 [Microctonus aethiopoides]|nr:hypothetical protein PV326_002737 [Microctonus aethiopoides]
MVGVKAPAAAAAAAAAAVTPPIPPLYLPSPPLLPSPPAAPSAAAPDQSQRQQCQCDGRRAGVLEFYGVMIRSVSTLPNLCRYKIHSEIECEIIKI